MLKAWSLIMMLCLSVLANASSDDALVLMERMTQASKELNYKGIFSYHTGQTLQSVRIYHRNDGNEELERLISLNGAAREVIRNNDTVTCINHEGNQVNVSQRPLGRGFPSDLPKRLRSATPFYEVTLGNDVRVAGRAAQEVFINPIDDYRYGYRLWVDKETDLLLKSELLSNEREVLETFAFSDIQTNVELADEMFEPEIVGNEMVQHNSEPKSMNNAANHAASSLWQASWLPEGFTLVATQNRLRAMNGALVEQRVFSDGLSSVSIFIEKIRAHHRHLHGSTHMGAVNAYGTIIHAHFITVVGEVPATTVNKIGAGIKFSGMQQP